MAAKPLTWRRGLYVTIVLAALGLLGYGLSMETNLRFAPSTVRLTGVPPSICNGTAAIGASSGGVANLTLATTAGAAGAAGAGAATVEPATGAAAQHPSLPHVWRTNHIFLGSSALEDCPKDDIISGSWMDKDNAHGFSGMLPFTSKAQRKIWEHQHPANCSSARFLIYRGPASGIGSMLHTETVHLGAALDSGRILYEPKGHILANHPYCGANSTLDTCYFERLTNCTLEDSEVAQAAGGGMEELSKQGGPRVMQLHMASVSNVRGSSPGAFHEDLARTAIQKDRWYFWWRAQAVAYIVRPHQRTREELARRLRLQFRGQPLALGCISLYIRHGDKGSEAPTFPDEHYENVVKRLLTTHGGLTRQLFLSTEDPATVSYYTEAFRGWMTSYVEMPMKPDAGPVLAYMQQRGVANEMLDCLLNLDLAMRCDAYVGSFWSNWARLIDELRSTVRCKAEAVYMDTKYEHPSEVDFNW